MSYWRLRVAKTVAARAFTRLTARYPERECERSLAHSRIREPESLRKRGIYEHWRDWNWRYWCSDRQKVKGYGYPVKMANSKGPDSLRELSAKTGAIPVSVEEVVQDVDILFLVLPQRRFQCCLKDF